MIDHKITVRDRVISIDNPDIVKDSIDSDRLILDLDDDWNDLEKIFVVLGVNQHSVVAVYDSEEDLMFPASLARNLGPVGVTIVGKNGDQTQITRRASRLIRVVPRGHLMDL